MHYIRFLKPPRLLESGKGGVHANVKAKVTVTTDLGESFLWADVDFVAEVTDGAGVSLLGKGQNLLWKGTEGMRSLEVDVRVDASIPKSALRNPEMSMRLHVRPKDDTYSIKNLVALLPAGDVNIEGGQIVGVSSMPVKIGGRGLDQGGGTPMAERVFGLGHATKLHIWEETGESIARHIWDAGLLLSAYLSSLSASCSGLPAPAKKQAQLPLFGKKLSRRDLRVIELGAGCGIVGITLAMLFPQISKILLTDLPEATEILSQNLSSRTLKISDPSKISHQVLDWSSPLPQNVKETTWDLVVVADCTYNPDVVPDLVQTLLRIGERNRDVVILLAMKVRHDSEMVFFELMATAGFVVAEKCAFPLPVLGGEDEEIEIFVFRLK